MFYSELLRVFKISKRIQFLQKLKEAACANRASCDDHHCDHQEPGPSSKHSNANRAPSDHHDDHQEWLINSDDSDLVWMRYKKNEKDKVYVKTNLQVEEFLCMKIKRKKGRKNQNPCSVYNEKLPISEAKKKDLMHLCAQNLIPRAYHGFYESLTIAKSARDSLPEPDLSEESE